MEREKQYKFLIVDDHPLVLEGTCHVLQQQYPNALPLTAKTAREALERINCETFDLVILDLSLPDTAEEEAEFEIGIQLLQTLMKKYPTLNLVILSSAVHKLTRIQNSIDNHEGGFAVARKSDDNLLVRVRMALEGGTHIQAIRNSQRGLEVRPEWLEVLHLAFKEELTDKAIAKKMGVADRTIRHYWTKIYDVLDIYRDDEPNKNLRLLTGNRARKKGLID